MLFTTRLTIAVPCHGAALSSAAARAPRRPFCSGMDPVKLRRLKASGICFNRPRGRDMATDMFEEKLHVVGCDSFADIMDGWTEATVAVDLVRVGDVQQGLLPPASPYRDFYERHGTTAFTAVARRNMRRNADTWLTTYGGAPPQATAAATTTDALTAERRSVVHCVDPDVTHRQYRREEAQVEIMTAYRNILYEVFDIASDGTAVDVVRIPALALSAAAEPRFHRDLGKLNQQGLVKGFHRVPNHVKDWYSCQTAMRLELYVPRGFFAEFDKAFAEEPWEVPSSAFTAPRTDLYPGLPVPRGLLDYPGWHGHRQELLDSVKTDGKSIADGVLLERCDAMRSAK